MNKIIKISTIAILVILFSGCEQIQSLISKKDGKQKARAMQMPPSTVNTITLKKQDVELDFEYPARIISDEDVQVRAKVAGTLLKKYFKAGQKVKKGDKLFTIDPTVYKAQYNIQVANEQVAIANLSQAQKEFNRISSLYSKKATSQKIFDSADATLQIAKANLSQAKATKESAKINYDYTEVVAPFDGIISDSLVDVGDLVSINSPLVRVTKVDVVYAQFYIPDVESFNLSSNQKNNLWTKINSLTTITYANKNYNGKIVYIDKIVDPANGSVKAKAEFENKNNDLVVGSFSKLHVKGFMQKNAYKIPQIALQQDLATTMVFVASPIPKDPKIPANVPAFMIPDAIVKAVPVSVDYEANDFILTSTKNLKPGDQIIMNNFKKIRPGDKIKLAGPYIVEPKKVEKK